MFYLKVSKQQTTKFGFSTLITIYDLGQWWWNRVSLMNAGELFLFKHNQEINERIKLENKTMDTANIAFWKKVLFFVKDV